jgi:hypothetical protein
MLRLALLQGRNSKRVIQYTHTGPLHHGVAVRCAAKGYGINGSVPSCVQKIFPWLEFGNHRCGWHYYKVEISHESFDDLNGVVVRCASKATLARVRFPHASKRFFLGSSFVVGTASRLKFNTNFSVTAMV